MPNFELLSDDLLVDEPLPIKLCGLEPGIAVMIRAEFCDDFGQSWASHTEFISDSNGEVDLLSAKPQRGTYQDADPMGLFWSMQLQSDAASQTTPFPNTATKSLNPLVVTLTARQNDLNIAQATVTRRFLADGVTQIDIREAKLVATLFVPNFHHPEESKVPIVLVLGGSGGGFGWSHQVAALLASHGCISMALAYFDWSGQHGLSQELAEISIEIFDEALEYLKSHFEFDLGNLAVIGYSKGAELALLLAATYAKIKKVVAYMPSSVVWNGVQMPQVTPRSSWRYQNRPLPFVRFPEGYFDEMGWQDHAALAEAVIPVEKISGLLLLISGTHDGVWPSTQMANMIMKRLESFSHSKKSKHLVFNGAGHNLSVPYLPSVTFAGQPWQLMQKRNV